MRIVKFNNNNGTEGNWGDMKKGVCESSGSTVGLAVCKVVSSLVRLIANNSKEQASYWTTDTKGKTFSVMFTFKGLPLLIKEDWFQGSRRMHRVQMP